MWGETLERNQTNLITFVLVDVAYVEVPGLGAGFNLEISKIGGGFVAGVGVKTEIGFGWYTYTLTAAECNTIGPLSIRVWGAGTIQQNLEYVVQQRNAGCIEFTYTVTDSVTLLPLDGVEIWVTTDAAGLNVVWYGTTDAVGVARDDYNRKPCLDAGTYFFWKQLAGYFDDDTPADVEVVS